MTLTEDDKRKIREMIWDEYVRIQEMRVKIADKKYKEITGKDWDHNNE